MAKLHIKKGDIVYVNAGDDKGKTGRVLEVLVKKTAPWWRASTSSPRAPSRQPSILRVES